MDVRWRHIKLLCPTLLLILTHMLVPATAFAPSQNSMPAFSRNAAYKSTGTRSPSSSALYVFDFLRQRSQEGLEQLNTLANATYSGNLGKGLIDVATYVSESNRAFAEGLAKSRNKFLQNLEAMFTGVDPEDILDELEDILLQADLGTATAQDIVQEVESLRDDSTTMLSRQDLMSIMRGKLVESLETPQKPRAIQFSETNNQPTVLFVMGAVSVLGIS